MSKPLHTALAVSAAFGLALAPPGGGLAQQRPDDATSVSDVVVRSPEVVAPLVGEGAPLYTAAELEAIQIQARKDAQTALSEALHCNERGDDNGGSVVEGPYSREYLTAVAIRSGAETAIAATRQAEQIRRGAAQGRNTQEEVHAAELARQVAVNRVVRARAEFAEAQAITADLQWLAKTYDMAPGSETFQLVARTEIPARAAERAYESGMRRRVVMQSFENLALENIALREQEDRRGRILQVTGSIRNKGGRPASTPPLEITALDSFGIPLQREIADPRGAGRIKPGATQNFSYTVRPRPANVAKITVAFGSDEYEPWRLPASAGGCFNFPIGLIGRPVMETAETVAPRLAFENLTLRPATENGVRSVTVSGMIRNVANTPAQTPAFGIVLYDQDDKILSTLRAEADGRPVPARGTKPFSLTFVLNGDARVSRAAVVPNLAQTAAR